MRAAIAGIYFVCVILSSCISAAEVAVADFARHEELERILGPRIVAEIDQPLIDDLRTRLGGDIASQVNVEFACDLQIIGGPSIALRVIEIDPAAARNGNEGICLRLLAVELQRGALLDGRLGQRKTIRPM